MSSDDALPEELETEESTDLAEEISRREVASAPSDTGDPTAIVEAKLPSDIRDRYEIYSYRYAAAIFQRLARLN